MERLTLLISPDADWLLPDSPEFLEALGDSNPDYDAVGFAIRNLGFIKFQMVHPSLLEIELHPRNVEMPALLAVQEKLLSSPARLFRIKYLETEWASEISSSAEHTITRLSELCAPAFTPPVHERFVVNPHDFSDLLDDEGNALRLLAQKWRVSFGNFDPSVVSLALTHGMLSRMLIAGIKPRQSEPVWRFIGDGHKWLGSCYQVEGIGQKVENMPDKDYGGWATEYYRSVAATGQPRYDIITGSIYYENEKGKPLKPINYERLMLPWKTSSNEVFVTMCSRLFDADTAPGAVRSAASRQRARIEAMSS